MPPIPLTTNHLNLLLWTGSIALITVALYMQYVMGLAPCALCVTQRIFVIATGVVAFTAWLHRPGAWGLRLYALAGSVMALIGGGFSSRHLWLQSLPEELAPACGPSLGYLLEAFPLTEAFSLLIRGDGNCAETLWSFLGITIPGWTLIAFIGLLLLNGLIFYQSWRHESPTRTILND